MTNRNARILQGSGLARRGRSKGDSREQRVAEYKIRSGLQKLPHWRNLPHPIAAAVGQAQNAVDKLVDIARSWGLKRRFTLDGRLVGDIGELLAARFCKVTLDEKQGRDGCDGSMLVRGRRRRVQIKCCRTSNVMDFKRRAPQLLVIKIDTTPRWRVVYNGTGARVSSTFAGGKVHRLTIAQLDKL